MNRYIVAIIYALLISGTAFGEPSNCVKGTVTHVDDGDTAKVRKTNGDVLNVRFYGVDSPEKIWPGRWPAQAFSSEAKTFMESLILDKSVCVRLTGDQTYKRVVGEIFLRDKSVSREIVKAGLAWWNTKYAPNDKTLKRLQQSARDTRKGLWVQANPEAPWEYRKRYPRK